MSEVGRTKSGGGAATAGGTTFQEDVACYFATLILAESAAEPPSALPQQVMLSSIVAETPQPIDDLLVGTSAGGVMYIQAKTSLFLSEDAESEFAKVLDQFARQYVAGVRLPGNTPRRPDKTRDRFILAVGYSTPATITTSFSSVLSKCRTINEPGRLDELPDSLNTEESKALALTRAHIDRSWTALKGLAPSATERLALIHLVHVLQLDLRVDGIHHTRAKDLLRQAVLTAADRAGDAWDALVAICRNFGPQRTGGDLAYLRAELERRSVPVRSVPSFSEDIRILQKYTSDRLAFLQRLSVIKLGGQPIKIARPALAALREFALSAHTAVIGEPGAGKSGCVHDLAHQLLTDDVDVVLIAADMLDASSPEALAKDLGLSRNRSLVDVLQSWSGEGSGFLLVDALDAARSGMSLHVLCEILQDVRERAPRWRIVASIREYDLRASPEVQDLFAGKPHAEFKDGQFGSVRHIRIGRLSPAELSQVTTAYTRVATALQATPSLSELVRNPFNLSLLCKLLDNNVSDAELGAVETQVGLLDLYWTRRVEACDRQARLLVLYAAVDRMVTARALHIQSHSLSAVVSSHTGAFDALLSDGVFIELAAKPTAPPIVGFSHNILFDYAVCRLWLDELSDAVVTKLSEPVNADLLLAIRPSIVMAFEELWSTDPSREGFWERATAFDQAPGMRLIGKIIAAGVAARMYTLVSDVAALLSALSKRSPSSVNLLRFTIQAAITQQDADPQYQLFGQNAAEWLPLAAALCEHLDQVAWEVRSLLWPVSRGCVPLTQAQACAANTAAVALLGFGLSNPRYHNVVRVAEEVAAITVACNPDATVKALAEVLRDENLAIGAHEWLHPLAERLQTIAHASPEFALQVTDVVFATSGDRDAAVPMGGRILPLTMNKHDLVRIARHDVQEVFEDIWERDPVTATRIFIRVMNATMQEEHAALTKPKRVHRFSFRGKMVTLTPDASHIWAAGEHHDREEWHQILSTFQAGMRKLAKSDGGATSLEAVLDVLRDEAALAVIWSSVLEAGAEDPETLGKAVSELLAATEILGEIETRKAAGDLIEKVFVHLPQGQQRSIEEAILRIPEDTPEELAEYADRRRDRMLGCIPPELLQSPELRKIRSALESAGGPPPNEPDFSISTSWGGGDDDWWLRRQGVTPEKPANAPLLRISKAVKAILRGGSSDKRISAGAAAEYLSLLLQADAALKQATDVDPPLVQQVDDEVIGACEQLAGSEGLQRDTPLVEFIRSTLRRGASAARPEYREEDDAQWDKDNTGWGSPSPRIDAALGLMRLAANPDTVDEQILADLDRLSKDPVPAVRFQVLTHCIWLYRTAPGLMWSCIEFACVVEPRTAILTHFSANVMLRMPSQDHDRFEHLVRTMYRRVRRNETIRAVRRFCATFYLRPALWRQDRRATAYVGVFANRPHVFPVESNTVVDHCRELIRYAKDDRPEENRRVRLWAFDYLTRVVNSVQRHASDLRTKHAKAPLDEWLKEDIDDLRHLHQIAHNVATELYIGSGASDERRGRRPDGDDDAPPPEVEKHQLVQEASQLFDALCDIEFVESAYHVLQTLEYLLGVDQAGVILRIAKLVRNAERDGIHYESMAADLVVRIVERYLAEYGNLFRENPQARTALLDILDIFVGAGWPGATRLTYRLGEVFR
jgi:hypothetical protein